MGSAAELTAEYVRERDDILIAGDVDRLIALHKKFNPDRAALLRDVAEIALHQSRTAIRTLPMVLRIVSKQWLLERDMKPLDDGDVPVAGKTKH